MSFGIPNTPENRALSAVVDRRIMSDTRRVAAIAAVYRFLGLGVFCFLLGAGVGAAMFGYSYISDGRTSVEKLSSAIAAALQNVKVTGEVGVTGSVPLDTADASVRLDTTSPVKLDTSGAVVRLDTKGAAVPLDAKSIPHPSERQLNNPAAPVSNAKTVTDFTVFKHVDIAGGQVITGWNFTSSDDAAPNHQYCYFTTQANDNVLTRFNLANNHVPVSPVRGLPINVRTALANCVWFDENRT